MKLTRFHSLGAIAAAVAAFLGVPKAPAQTNAYDDAFHYIKANWNTSNGVPQYEGGFGFTPWVLATNGPSSHGFFTTHNGTTTPLPTIDSPTNFTATGSPPGNDNNAHVWGMFANGTGANMAVAYRGFSNSLDTTVVFKLQWQNDGIGNTSGNSGGFVLRNGNPTNGAADYRTGQRFSFYYIGGAQNSFVYWDNNGVSYINIPFTSVGLSTEFTLEANDTYRFVVKNATNNNILAIVDGQPLITTTPGTSIDSVALFAQQTSANQEFNRMQIVSASLTPPTIVNILPTNGSIYVDPAVNNVSFEVDSLASAVASNTVTLLLNGVAQSNLTVNTAGPTNQLLVANNTPLLGNTLYTATIIATDTNGNRATNSVTFNTFLQTDNFIEAEDYNFNNGQFLAGAFPDSFDGYSGAAGNNGVDFFDTTASNLNVYRLDLPQVLAGNDPVDHANYQGGGFSDYYLGYNDTGDWEDYTRVFPTNNYTVYARMAGFGTGPIMEMERLANSTATTSTQPLAAVGRFIVPNTGGTSNYALVPLTDLFGNTVQVSSPGTNTFRCTSVGGDRTYNFNYLILVPSSSTNVIRPYISAGSPTPNAGAVGLDSPISFTIANGQTSVNPATINLFVNSTNVTGGAIIGNNAAGSTVSYASANLLAPNSTYTVTATYTDTASVSITNTWQFTTVAATAAIVPAGDALPPGSGTTNGFALTIYKIDNGAPTTASLSNAEQELIGAIINPTNSQPYPNLAANGGLFLESGTINYDITGAPTGTPTFNFKSAFPDLTAGAPDNNFAMQALMYLQLSAGNYHFQVRSDDGFRFTIGTTPTDTNLVLGQFDGGRGNGTPSDIYFTVLANGLYPARLLYYQAGSGGNVEFYSIYNGTTPILINDGSNPNSITAYAAVAASGSPVTLLNPAHSGGVTTFSFQTQSGHTHLVQYKNVLTDPVWTLLQTVPGDGTVANITDNGASTATRFYRVVTQ